MNKPDDRAPDAFNLPERQLIALTGADAARFAQAQLMNDVAALDDGQWQWNGWLTPKGRLIALLIVLRYDGHCIWLLPLDADAQTLAARLRGFIFRSKVAIEVRRDMFVNARFAAPTSAIGARAGHLPGGDIELDLGAAGGPRALLICAAAAIADPAAVQRWAAFDIAHGLPRLAAEQNEQWTPQQLSLDRLHAYSLRKGCYPGQEIVARTHFLGQAKRRLSRLEGAGVGALAEVFPAQQHDDPAVRALGQVICAAGDQALAVMPCDIAPDQALSTGGAVAVQQPLLDGLQR